MIQIGVFPFFDIRLVCCRRHTHTHGETSRYLKCLHKPYDHMITSVCVRNRCLCAPGRTHARSHALYIRNNKLSRLCLYLLMRALKCCLLGISFRYQSTASFPQCCYTTAAAAAVAVVVLFRGQFLAIYGFDKK